MTLRGAERVLGGRYRLVREIARGGMAAVWEAHDALLDRRVAVKLLHPQYAGDPEFLERFRREARAAARLSHPNIVPIYDVGEDADTATPYIVMELVEGENLKDRIRRSAPLADAEIRSVGATLASALEYAHQKGLIHRDIKPQNVLLGEDGRPRLTDFGIAEAMASSGLTRTGSIMGSVHYIAPELVRGRPAVPQSDVYSLGAVLYEMATGRVPFHGQTDLAIALAHVEETPPAPRVLNAHLAPDLERIIMRSLAKSPEHRFASAEDFGAHLRGGTTAGTSARPRAITAAAEPTQRIPTVAVGRSPVPARRPPAPQGPFARRTTRPLRRRGAGTGVLVLLLAMAAVLVALGAGFFGLATLSREGVAPPEPTAPPTVRPTAVPKPAAVASSTPAPGPTSTPQSTDTPEPSPTPVPTPVPSSPTPQPQPTATAAPKVIPVPQLRGKTLDQAQVALQADGLTATVIGAPANVEKNVVFDQSPDVGATLPSGGTVTIRVGSGSTAIPNVANAPREQAIASLQNNSFRVTTRDRRDPRIPGGVAIGTTPGAGTVAPRGSAVTLDISAGR
jgi:tRNA A-37 threonylcarbamoyl transferase component Bud32